MSELIVTHEGATALVTICNPGKRNAMTPEMWRSWPGIIAELEADSGVRVVVVTGAGGDFSAGSDITGLGRPADATASTEAERALARCAKPVIAAIEGYCLGGGCQVALAADLRVAADDARFAIPPANLGIVYPLPGLQNLVHLVGPAHAKRLIFTGDRIDATEALRIGMVDELQPVTGVLARAMALAERVGSRSQLSIHAAKEMIRATLDGTAAEAVAQGWLAEAATGVDLAEGQAAFAAKREPQFTWNGRRDGGQPAGRPTR